MAYLATVLPVMIASPGDVDEQRSAARDIINDWNYINSLVLNTVLMPVGWETHSAPDLGGRAQGIINERVLSDCDLLVGIFWTRLGTPTGGFESGTAEEIQRHLDEGKPAMVYFSSAPIAPQSIDPLQFSALNQFKDWCKDRGIIETFSNALDFREKFSRHLQIQINTNPVIKEILQSSAIGTQQVVAPPEPLLAEESVTLLLEASEDRAGYIMKISTLSGQHIQTNGKSFGDPSSTRSSALWEFALNQLESLGYVTNRGSKGEIFQVTKSGYEMADSLKSQGKN